MLTELTVENIAIIERVQVSLGPGLTALTGETGAGKSLLVDAIELALGERADSDLIRKGASRAQVTAVFDLSSRPDIADRAEALGYGPEDGCLIVHRELVAEGRSQCRLNGKTAPLSVLKEIGAALVDLHGQHDHQALLHPESHVGMLDLWIGAQALELLTRIDRAHGEWQQLKRSLQGLMTGQREREARIDLLRFQISEITSGGLVPGELAQAEATLARLKNAERIAEAVAAARRQLSDEGAALDLLRTAATETSHAARWDASLEAAAEQLESAAISAGEALQTLAQYAYEMEADGAALEETAERLDLLRRMIRKYTDSESDDPVGAVLEYSEAAASELELLESGEASAGELEGKVQDAFSRLERLACELTDLRTKKSEDFAAGVQAELRELAMEKAQFQVQMRPRAVDGTGADDVEFLFSANLGEAIRPLAKSASGGEISRAMLAIKTVLAGKAGVPTLIFDEVDAGLSGKAAFVVGAKLKGLAQHSQVIVITHLPQIAARAVSHFRIQKSESEGRVRTDLLALHGSAREEEIARVLSGDQVTPAALSNARELLAST